MEKKSIERVSQKGQFAEFRITEQFEDARVFAALAIGRQSSVFDVFVNDVCALENLNLNSQHAGITTPLVDLGIHKPIDNAFVVRFEFSGRHPGERVLSLDYFRLGAR